MKLKKHDEVMVIRGKDKGKMGKIEQVFPFKKRVLVTGINQYKRHIKGRAQGQKSEIVTITKPLPEASVLFMCPKCHEKSRLGYTIKKDKKVRICKKCEEAV